MHPTPHLKPAQVQATNVRKPLIWYRLRGADHGSPATVAAVHVGYRWAETHLITKLVGVTFIDRLGGEQKRVVLNDATVGGAVGVTVLRHIC